jgi:RND family efflux transporter MFP subunit
MLFGAMLMFGCQRGNKFVAPPPPAVSVAKPLVTKVSDSIEFIGNTRATATVELRARVTGYLERIAFEEGTNVKEGDLLFVIDQAPFQVALDIANAELQRAQADLQLQQTEYRRTETLVAQKAQTQADLDLAAAELATANANVAAAQAAVRRAELDLSYTEIRAPISGRIGRHLVDRGSLVQGEQTHLATIESLDPIHAYFSLSEPDLLRFMEMLRANEIPDPDKNPPVLYLGLDNSAGYPYQGTLDFRELGVDPSTGTALRRGLFANPNNELLPGLFVRIRAPIGEPKERLVVEKRGIGADQRGDYVLVVNDKNIVEYRLVKLGISTDGMRVVQEGVEPGEWIVVNGLQRARPGATVDPERVTMTMGPTDDGVVTPAKDANPPASGAQPAATSEPGESSE